MYFRCLRADVPFPRATKEIGDVCTQASIFVCTSVYGMVSSPFFESEPNEIYSHVSEKGSKGRFFCAKKLENHNIEGKGKEKKKERGGRKEEKRKKQWLHS